MQSSSFRNFIREIPQNFQNVNKNKKEQTNIWALVLIA